MLVFLEPARAPILGFSSLAVVLKPSPGIKYGKYRYSSPNILHSYKSSLPIYYKLILHVLKHLWQLRSLHALAVLLASIEAIAVPCISQNSDILAVFLVST